MSKTRAPLYRLAQGVLSVPVENEAVLLTISSGKYYGVRGSMRHLLEDLREGLSVEDMVDRTCARYDVDRASATADVEQMVARMTETGILETAPA